MKVATQTVVHILLDAAGAIGQAWKVTRFAFVEEGKDPQPLNNEEDSIKPEDLAAALPSLADVVAQLGQKDAAYAELKATADASARAAADRIVQLQAELAEALSRLNQAQAHVASAAAAIGPPPAAANG